MEGASLSAEASRARRGRFGRIGGAVALVLIGVVVGQALPRVAVKAQGTDPLGTVKLVYDLLQADFAGHVSSQALVTGALEGMLQATGDPFTQYLAPASSQDFSDSLNGFSGVGIRIATTAQGDVIMQVLTDSPASNSGLLPGDVIVAVDGHPTAGVPLATVAQEIRGPVGSTVHLEVLVPGGVGSSPISVTRGFVAPDTVFASVPKPGIGLIQITEFGSATAAQFAKAYQGLQQEPGGLRGLVLDLRGNPGGYLDAAVKIADMLVPPGPFLQLVNAHGQVTTYSAPEHAPAPPIVVLVDGNTASAAEILAGALQYRGTALVGATTYGKGTVQEVFPLPGGAAVKVTVAHDQLPSGVSWNHHGLVPNVQVVPPTPPAPPSFLPLAGGELVSGAVGLDVLAVQQRLEYLGLLHDDTSGVLDGATTAAVQTLQRQNGLAITGRVGPTDAQTLQNLVDARILQQEQSPRGDSVLEKGLELLQGAMGGPSA